MLLLLTLLNLFELLIFVYSVIISNLDIQSSNNNSYPCHFKIIVNAQNNSIYFSGESNSYIQALELNHKTLTSLNIEIQE